MTGKIEAPFVFGVRVEGDTFTDRHEETERLKANFTYPPTEFAEPTETTARKISSHRIHRIHRSFWRRIFSHRFHRCSQMVRLRRVLWLLWKDSLVAAWVWQGCHTLLICAHL